MKIAIVGGVAGGASTAARLRRMDEHAEISLFEKGAHISYANCGLPYYVGDVITDRNRLLVQTAEAFRQRFNVAVNTESEVTAIHRDKKTISVRNLRNQHDYEVRYDKLVLATGAAPIRLPVPGIDSAGIFTLRNVQDTDKIKNYINEHAPKKAVVIGAGFIGLEMAENLHHLGLAVTIIETGKQVLPPVDYAFAAFVQQDLRAKGVQLMLNSTVSGFEVNDKHLRVQLQDKGAIEADIVVSSVGVRPDTKLAADAGLALGKRGGILVNEYLQTSDPSIYALG
ncbi:MAG TPA: FAD-dependent oxidoreductase, partial [Flavihumibacter sp.]|nr:FAD-dependent oxidoreductase [Flavihumibacter sp.]